MYKILVTSGYKVKYGPSSACSCHTLVIEFQSLQEAEEAMVVINLQHYDKDFHQEAVALYRVALASDTPK